MLFASNLPHKVKHDDCIIRGKTDRLGCYCGSTADKRQVDMVSEAHNNGLLLANLPHIEEQYKGINKQNPTSKDGQCTYGNSASEMQFKAKGKKTDVNVSRQAGEIIYDRYSKDCLLYTSPSPRDS